MSFQNVEEEVVNSPSFEDQCANSSNFKDQVSLTGIINQIDNDVAESGILIEFNNVFVLAFQCSSECVIMLQC